MKTLKVEILWKFRIFKRKNEILRNFEILEKKIEL